MKENKMKSLLKKIDIKNTSTYLVVIIGYFVLNYMSTGGMLTRQMKGLLVPLCLYIVLAISLNLVVGISGELSLGHAGFMSVGVYSAAFITKYCQYNEILSKKEDQMTLFIIAVLFAAIVAAFAGLVIGIPVLRLRGDYLAIVTLAFGEIIKNIFNAIYLGVDENGVHFSMESAAELEMAEGGKIIFNGAMGISQMPRVATFTICFVTILIVLFIILNFIKSRAGRAVMAIRDNRIAAESIGISITKYKLMTFVLSAAIAGVAGAIYAHNYAIVAPSDFDYNKSILILVFVVLGGIGNMLGSVIATAVIYVLPEMFRELNDYRMLMYAIVLIVMMIYTSSPAVIKAREVAFGRLKEKLFGKKAKAAGDVEIETEVSEKEVEEAAEGEVEETGEDAVADKTQEKEGE